MMRSRSETPSRVLLVEDAVETQLIVRAALQDYMVVAVGSTAAAREALSGREPFALIILDVGLPDGDGFTLCREIRGSSSHSETPVLFLSGRQADVDKVLAFGEGADDYVTKPFSPLELQARVRARIRRSGGSISDESKPDQNFEQFRLSHNERSVVLPNGQVIPLTQIEYRLLTFLTDRPDVIRSRQEIIQKV